MTTEHYRWDLEECIEDAFVGYVKNYAYRVSMVTAANEVHEAKFPLVVVSCEQSRNKNDDSTFSGKRLIDVTLHIVTEAINYNGDGGTAEALESARETHRIIKSQVIGIFAGTDVHTELNNLDPVGVLFSSVHLMGQTRDVGDGKLITEQMLEVIAQPREA